MLTSIFNLLTSISEAFRRAWNDDEAGKTLITAILNLLTTIFSTIKSIADAFKTAFDNKGEEIFKSILSLLTSILNIINDIITAFKNAWEANDNGVVIWKTILGIIDDILATVNDMSFATLEWAKSLDLEPLITAFKDLLEAMRPFIDIVLDGLEFVYTEILLPMSKWALETLIPKTLDTLKDAFDTLNVIFEAIKPGATWIWEEFLKPLGEWTGGKILEVLGFIGQKFKDITEWIKENGEIINTAVEGIGKILKFVWENAIKPTLEFFGSLFAEIIDGIGLRIADLITVFSGLVEFIEGVMTGDWEKAWNGIKNILKGVLNFIIDDINALGRGLANAVSGIINVVISGINAMIQGVLAPLNLLIDGLNLIPNVNISKLSFSIPSVPSFGQFVPQIPKLARGGIVDSATIAMIGEKGREAVVPLSQNAEWMKPMQEVRDEINGLKDLMRELIEVTRAKRDIYMNGRTVAEEVTHEQRSIARQSGKSLLPM